MEATGSINVVDVTTNNVAVVGPHILKAIETADFVAIDQELSGLGNTAGRSKLDLSSYYVKLADAAKTRKVISLGISCFKSSKDFVKPHPECCDPLVFTCATFNVLLIPKGDFEMDGSARRFLVAHGFDLNNWLQTGICYSQNGIHSDFAFRIVSKLISTKANIVFHNGLSDLVYFYDSFYNPLPQKLNTFTADIVELFGGRLFDTKVLCNKILEWRIHNLEYCFKKSQRVTQSASALGKPSVILQPALFPVTLEPTVNIPLHFQRKQFPHKPKVGTDVCELLYHYGFCNSYKQGTCPHPVELHQFDLVLDVEDYKEAHKIEEEEKNIADGTSTLAEEAKEREQLEITINRGNKVAENSSTGEEPVAGCSEIQPDESESSPASVAGSSFGRTSVPARGRGYGPRRQVATTRHPQRLGTSHFSLDNGKTYNTEFGVHSAGFDAFMTGYVFATCMSQLGRIEVDGRVQFKKTSGIVDHVHVTGKPEPCYFGKSSYGQPSAKHSKKFARIIEAKSVIIDKESLTGQ